MRSLFTFGVMGGFVTVVHVTLGLFMHHAVGLSAFWANFVAFCVGFFLSYFGHRRYSFRSRAAVSHSMPRFFVVAITSLVLNQGSVYVIVNMLGQPYIIALGVAILLVGGFGYMMGRLWAFSDGEF